MEAVAASAACPSHPVVTIWAISALKSPNFDSIDFPRVSQPWAASCKTPEPRPSTIALICGWLHDAQLSTVVMDAGSVP